jgi:CheY-like chemotaxis protein
MAKILYVEDGKTEQIVFTAAFKAAGHEVTACHDFPSAQLALKAAQESKKPFDLTISDGQYTGDNVRFTAGVHRSFAGSACLLQEHKQLGVTTPVVILTGDAAFLQKNPYPAECQQPLHILDKLAIKPKRFAEDIPQFIALAARL